MSARRRRHLRAERYFCLIFTKPPRRASGRPSGGRRFAASLPPVRLSTSRRRSGGAPSSRGSLASTSAPGRRRSPEGPSSGFGSQEASQADGQEEAPQAPEEDAHPASSPG